MANGLAAWGAIEQSNQGKGNWAKNSPEGES
jgi:hypothetical protein